MAIRSGIGVPVSGPAEPPWGVLAAYGREERDFTEEDAAYLETVSNVLASAIGQRTVLERERET